MDVMTMLLIAFAIGFFGLVITLMVFGFYYKEKAKTELDAKKKVVDLTIKNDTCVMEIESLKVANKKLVESVAAKEERIQQLNYLKKYEINLSVDEVKDAVYKAFLPFFRNTINVNYSDSENPLIVDVELDGEATALTLPYVIDRAMGNLITPLSILQRLELGLIMVNVFTVMRDVYGKPWRRSILDISLSKETRRKIRWEFIKPEGLIAVADTSWRRDGDIKNDSADIMIDDDIGG